MPELPDVEAYARNLEKRVAGQAVTEVLLFRPRKANVTAKQLNNAVAAAKPVALAHDGKEVLIRFDNGKTVRIHLMLEGKFDLTSSVDDIEFKLFAFRFGERYLVVTDPKGWAKLELEPHGSQAPDALSEDFSLGYFLAKLGEKKSKNIKAFLIEQAIIRGIGNAYADEILWEARVSPESKAGKLPKAVAKRLYRAIGIVLRRSVDEILHIAPDIINGEIRDFMRVHNRKRKTSPNGFPIHTKLIASKTTYYTEEQIKY